MGPCLINLAALIIMVACIRPPKDSTPTDTGGPSDELIYWILIFYHIMLGSIKWVSLYVSRLLLAAMTVIMFCVVFMITWLKQKWLYVPGRLVKERTPEQEEFEQWLWFEVLLVYSYICGAAVYILFNKFAKTKVTMRSNLQDRWCFGDFLDAHMIMLDLTNSIFSPAILALMWRKTNTDHIKSDGSDKLAVGLLCLGLIQSLCLIIGIAANGASVNRRKTYNRLCPTIIKWCVYMALLIMPVAIIITSIIGLATQEKVTFFPPFMIVVSTLLIACSFFKYRPIFEEHFKKTA